MSDKAIDPALIARMESFGGRELKLQLIDMFLERMPERTEQITQGIQNGDAEQVERTAHVLISSAGNLGGFLVSRLSAALESAAMAGDFEKMTELSTEIASAVDEFETFLRQQKDLA